MERRLLREVSDNRSAGIQGEELRLLPVSQAQENWLFSMILYGDFLAGNRHLHRFALVHKLEYIPFPLGGQGGIQVDFAAPVPESSNPITTAIQVPAMLVMWQPSSVSLL